VTVTPGVRPTTPSQTVGPFFQFLIRPGEERVVAADDPRAVRLEGRVVDGAGEPVPDAMVEIWQADPEGRYPHPDDPRNGECEPSFAGFARSGTDADGRYRFVTVIPGRVVAPDGQLQAAHAVVSVFARGLLDRVVTRVYFPVDDDALAADPVLASVEPERRPTLIARKSADGFEFDIRLQGEDETVFFDV
jgi:protocatechuate 3,4-dioxygenase, alpha subunit